MTRPSRHGQVWRIGHVRTLDFRTYGPNPYNPIFVRSENREPFDCDGVLTPQVIEIGDSDYMVYLTICAITFLAGTTLSRAKRKRAVATELNA